MEKFRVCLVGAGEICGFHAQMLQNIGNAEIVAVCDPNLARAEALCQRYGIKNAFGSFDELLASVTPDVAHILVPPALHAEYACKALARGCHALVEKPMALSLEDATAMVAMSQKTGRRLAVCEIYCFDPLIMRATRMIAKGLIGDVVHVEGYWFSNVRGQSNAYSTKGGRDGWAYCLRGGVFANFLDHIVYLQRNFIGEVASVEAMALRIGDNPFVLYDELRVSLSGLGRTGEIVSSLNMKPRMNMLRVYGTEGFVNIDMSNMALTIIPNKKLPGFVAKGMNNFRQSYMLVRDTISTTASIITKRLLPRPGLQNLLHAYYGTLSDQPHPVLNAETALKTIQILEGVWSSIEARGIADSTGGKVNYKTLNSFQPICPKSNFSPTKEIALVTGGSGFLAKHLIRRLQEDGYVARLVTRKREEELEVSPDAQVIYGDIRNPETVRAAVKGVSVIFHCAAKVSNKGTWEDFEESNITATQLLLDEATSNGVKKFVYVSTVAVYGFNKRHGGRALGEHDSFGRFYSPFCYYPKSKGVAEQVALGFNDKNGLGVSVIRPGILFGPGGKNILRQKKIVLGVKSAVLPYTYITNVVDALMLASASAKANGQVYNVVNSEKITCGAFAKLVSQTTGCRSGFFVPRVILFALAIVLERIFLARKSKNAPPFGLFQYRQMARRLVYDTHKIRTELGWSDRISVAEGLTRMYTLSQEPSEIRTKPPEAEWPDARGQRPAGTVGDNCETSTQKTY